MDFLWALVQLLIMLLVAALFIAGLAMVVGSLDTLGSGSSPDSIVKRTRAETDQVVMEGRRAMDEISEAYLAQLYRQATTETQQTETAQTSADRR